jgi:phosphate transport system protein
MEAETTDTIFEAQLDQIRARLLGMGEKVELMIAESVRALSQRDSLLGASIIISDLEVKIMGQEIDGTCLRLLGELPTEAQHSYFITQAMKIAIDLERISDQCASIARSALELNGEARLKPCIDLTLMAEAANLSVRDALHAFLAGNNALAVKVFQGARVVDEFNDQIQRVLLTVMMEDPTTIWRALKINSISKYLETIADHAGNMAETVILMINGKNSRSSAA